MVSSRNLTSKRTASSTRLTVLLLFLLVVGVGCIYEFAFARPSFQAAWEKIQKIDQSRDSSNKTAAEIEELMGAPPFEPLKMCTKTVSCRLIAGKAVCW